MPSLREKFGQRVKHLRKLAGLTQEELANKADFSVDFLSLVERGINAPSFDNIEKLAEALEVQPQELFYFSDDEIANK